MIMRRQFTALLILFLVGTGFLQLIHAGEIFSRGSKWNYYKGNDHPSGGDLEWTEVDFDESDWLNGKSPFRYGDGSGGTLLSDMPNKYTTVFFRKFFTVANPKDISELDFIIDYDDGFIVWINGEEVLNVGGVDEPDYDSLATVGHESGTFETFALQDPGSFLVKGKNVISIMGLNVGMNSSDFLMNSELQSFQSDKSNPKVVSIDPPSGEVGSLHEVTIRFNEEVDGIDAGDLWINGEPAKALRGESALWTFIFEQRNFQDAILSWNPNHSIVDSARPPNKLDVNSATKTHQYWIVDDMSPTLTSVLPPPGSSVRSLDRIRIFFSEPIRGLDLGDLLINGEQPLSIDGVASGPWEIRFEPVVSGIVTVEWAGQHGVTDLALEPNPLVVEGWDYKVKADYEFGQVVINEFVAANRDGLKDEEGDVGDWIEFLNVGSKSVSLEGWSLTDDEDKPGKWVFPDVDIKSGATIVVHASGKNRSRVGQALHTNFKLGIDGEYLGIFTPELPRRIVDEIAPIYPEQRSDISYGRLASGDWAWFSSPTPGLSNKGKTIRGLISPPQFSAKRGIYNTPFRVHLTTDEPDAVIRYTTDYSEPTITNGKVYNESLEVRRTMVLRAAVYKEGMLPSRIETHTYVYNLGNSVTSLPMLSLVTERSNLWGRTGIMETSPRNTTKRGIAWERPVSMELIYPDTGETLHANAGLRVQGGAYIRGRYNPNSGPPAGKYSFRLYFRGDYGLGRLRYPFFPDLQVEDFNHIVLRAGMNDHTNPFIIDELVRRLAADMGQISARGTFMNLYLNGKLQGYYNPTERIDSDFLNSWNGTDSDWDIVAQYGEVREGDTVMWNRLKSAMQKNLAVAVNYNEIERLLNIDNFIDYIMLNVYANTGDWPHNNWRAARERVPGGKWRFIPWDAEWSFGNNGRSVSGNNLSSGPLAGGADIAVFYRALQKNPEFRMRFADRVQIHYFNSGALTDENVLRRFREMKEQMSGVLKNLNSSVESSWVPRRREIVMGQMASQKIQFSENIPQFNRNGGAVSSGYPLSITSLEGDIYYTMDGSDPRKPGAVTETGKAIITGNAEKSVLVPSVQNGGSKLNSTWRGGNEPFDDNDWESGFGGVGYDENNDYKSHIDIDVDTEMNGVNQSIFVRIPFQMLASDLKGANLLMLRMKYDDGFVAYINGARIARVNASVNPRWNAGASGQHDDASAVVWSVFDVSKYVGELNAGENILAIHGLNSGLGSSDMLINAELSIGERTGAEFAESAVKYDSPIKLLKDVNIRARSMTGGQWSALVEHQFQVGRVGTPLRFTEIMYNPLGGGEYEFVELHNSGDSEISLGWYRLEGINFTFDGGSKIGPGQYIVLASGDDPAAFNLRYPELQVYGWYEGSLSNSGENLALYDTAWREVISVNYNDGGAWPKLADGNGNSLELIDTLDDPSAASNWKSSFIKEGSPGKAGTSKVDPFLIINEVHLKSSIDSDQDFVELRNVGQSQVDLSGWELRDNDGNKFTFPAETKIEKAGLLGIWCGKGEVAGLRTNFGLGQSGDSVALFDVTGNRVDAVTFGSVQGSIIRENAGWVLGRSTFGAPNQILPMASITELVINEWMADPDEGDRDWIELYNPHATAPALITGLHIRVDNEVGGVNRIATIPPKGYQRVWMDMKPGWNHVDLSLPTENGTITLITAEGVEFAIMNYSRQRSGVSEGLLPDGGSRRVKFTRGSTPGEANILPNYDGPSLNEVLARSKTGSSDWIEIYNDTNETIPLEGVRLSKGLNSLNGWSFPAGSKLDKGSYLVVRCDGKIPASNTNTGFSLPAEGGSVYMFDPEGFVVDSVEYGFQIAGRSIGQILGKWRLLAELTPGTENSSTAILGDPFKLVINEWMANPNSGSDWFELYNPDDSPVSLSGLSLTDDPTAVGRTKYIIPDSTFISPRGWVRWIANSETDSGSQYLNFSLRGSGELVRLYGSRRNPIDEVQIINQSNGISRGRLPDGANNFVDFVDTPTPGDSNYLPLLDIVFNEVLSHTDYPFEDAIELRNISTSEVDLSGWLLSDSSGGVSTQFKVPEGTMIPPNGYTVFYEGDFNPNGSGFSLNSAHGDMLNLSVIDEKGNPTGYRSVQSIPPAANGVSVGLVSTSQGMRFTALAQRSFGNDMPSTLADFRTGEGSENSLPLIGPIVINEIQFEALSSFSELDQAQLEYIELHNISNRTIPLFNPIEPLNTWRLSGGVSVTFPIGINLPIDGYILLVGFDPLKNPSVESRFRDYYNVPEDIQIIGPLNGRLSNGGETISLLRPDNKQGLDQADAGYVPYISVERISYDNVSPWPSNAGGSGLSIQRTSKFKFGDEPENWYSALPTAGRKNVDVKIDDLDADGIIDTWEIANGLDPSDASDAKIDNDLDGVTNLDEFLTGTDPNNEEDRFIIQSINIFSNKVTINFRVSPLNRYAIETSGSVDRSWIRLADFTAKDDQIMANFETNLLLDSVRFYRVRLLD